VSYTVVSVHNNTFDILETGWQSRIELRVTKQEANKIARKLNLGSGFGKGPVPEFFCSKTSN